MLRCALHDDLFVVYLGATTYLNSVAFNFDPNNPPRLDRTAFSGRAHPIR